MSQRELAHRAGVSTSMISQIENGRSYPSLSTLYRIGSTLDFCFDELIGGRATVTVSVARREYAGKITEVATAPPRRRL